MNIHWLSPRPPPTWPSAVSALGLTHPLTIYWLSPRPHTPLDHTVSQPPPPLDHILAQPSASHPPLTIRCLSPRPHTPPCPSPGSALGPSGQSPVNCSAISVNTVRSIDGASCARIYYRVPFLGETLWLNQPPRYMTKCRGPSLPFHNLRLTGIGSFPLLNISQLVYPGHNRTASFSSHTLSFSVQHSHNKI